MDNASNTTALLKNQAYDETNEVSYAVLDVSPEHINDIADGNYASKENRLLQQISAAINVRLTLVDDQNFPYVYFDNFISLFGFDKVFLYGPSGCGKSRGVLEIIRLNIHHVERVYVINPRNVVGLELGRAPLMDIVNMFSENDMIIWDNFPDDLIRRDYSNVLRVLELLSSRNVKKLVVALKPKYMEYFRGLPKEIPEFFSNEIAYGKESFKAMVKNYGVNISQFKETYSKYVSKDLEKIANILWNKEPTPLTVLDYYNELRGKPSKNGEMQEGYRSNNQITHKSFVGVIEAEKLPRSSNYYGHQFALLTSLQERQADVDFLYVLQMCYELGLERTETNVTNLQQAIFGSTSPKEPHKKLGNWLYMVGKQYSIHDVCRESIKLKDDIKVKILSYVSNNFNKIIPTSSSQVNRFGLFLGRNIELLAPVQSDGFLPESVYSFMKKNASFEKAIGQGAGEVFPSINDQFRKILLNNSDAEIEFGIGMAESLGLVFPLLDYDQRQLIFRKIYDSLLFARFFGQSLGRYIKDLEQEIRQEILDHTNVNPQFADGIGIGVGQVFEFLNDDLKDEIKSRANVSVDITRGLGCGSALSIQSPNDDHVKDVYAKAEINNEFDAGLGCGFGMLYSSLPEDHKIQVLKRCDNHIEFSYGFGLYSAYLSAENCPEELLSMADRNVSLAVGLGLGFGIKFLYLPSEFQAFLLEKSKVNLMLDFGLGFGTGLIYRHLPSDLQTRFLDQGNKQNEFDMGLGFGMGWAWIYLSPENKDQAFVRCKTNYGFAYGVGIGQGYHFKYLSEGERGNILKKADESAHYDNGLGFGLGESFLNLGEKLQNQALSRTMTNNFFAYGLSSGLGMVFSYLSPQFQEDLFSRSIDNGWFARGLGFGIGRYSMSYFNEELQSKILLKTKENVEFAVGLGEGVGSSFSYYKDFQKELSGGIIGRNNSNNGDNPFYRRGLGIGLGKRFVYLSQGYRNDVFGLAEKDMHFAVGLGEGIGYIFGYLDQFNQNEILSKTSSFADSGFAKGFAMGVGATFDYLEKPIATLLASRSKEIQFSMGLGRGLGSTYRYLSQPKIKSLYMQARNNRYFAVGLGEGIGDVFPYLSTDLMGETMAEADGNEEFATGLGHGMSISCRNNELKFREAYYSAANKNIAKGFAHGFGMSYPFLRENVQKELGTVSEKDKHFAKEFGFSLGHAYSDLNPHNNPFEYFGGLLKKNPEFDFGLGAGVGHRFIFLNTRTQENMLSMAIETNDFGCGFGVGLSSSFRHADAIMAQEILRQAAEVDSGFSYSLGYGLGNTFPSLSENTQKKVMGVAGRDCWFARGFAKNIVNSLKYLDGCLQGETSKLVEQNASYWSQLKDEDSNGLEEMHHKIGMMENGLSYYLFPILGLTDNGVVSNDWISEIDNEVVFSGQQKGCCVGIIDMISSTKIASSLEKTQLSKYYSIFLNAMATIIKNFGGKIVKNGGDALIFYFPDAVDLSAAAMPKAKEVLECGVTMSVAHGIINAKMHNEGLPPVNYRTSVDYGQVEVAASKSSQNEDLFGSAINICAKINGKAPPNGMIIGEGLFKMLGNAFDADYLIEPAGEVVLSLEGRENYPVYHVKGKGKTALNPFKHKIS